MVVFSGKHQGSHTYDLMQRFARVLSAVEWVQGRERRALRADGLKDKSRKRETSA